ncbi:hypothetical protein ACFQ68_00160 [Amycolatopsis japonica]|uniref:hypothetical protein n=1 Tax=Amycolatopsis japonica TaxID=208439 RepID=UPI00366EE516
MAFNALWKPGSNAVAGMQEDGSNNPALVIYLDPDSLAILPPADPAARPEFIRLLREIRDSADELAVFLTKQSAGTRQESEHVASGPIDSGGGAESAAGSAHGDGGGSVG